MRALNGCVVVEWQRRAWSECECSTGRRKVSVSWCWGRREGGGGLVQKEQGWKGAWGLEEAGAGTESRAGVFGWDLLREALKRGQGL